jgi:CheY-like chemotaxis protein
MTPSLGRESRTAPFRSGPERNAVRPVVLVTDSDPELADLFRLFLVEMGYVVETASKALECLERLRRNPPDVLVLDRELLWGGGDGVLARLREEGPVPVPAVVLTTGDDADPPEPLGAPVVACLRKPFTLAKLLKNIANSQEDGREEAE